MVAVLLVACSHDPRDTGPHEQPLDDALRFAHLQALGTHNSYHLAPDGSDGTPLDYTREPLAEQLDLGVRQFELDLYWDDDEILVYHLPLVDMASVCERLVDCLIDLEAWSADHPMHHPLAVLIEPKATWVEAEGATRIAAIETALRATWPIDRIVTPAEVIGSAPSLSEGIQTAGWPTLGALRGRALFVLHDGGEWRNAYLARGPDLLFPDLQTTLDDPWAGFHVINDPEADAELIGEAVGRGFLVRTRADSDNVEPFAADTSRLEAALTSGAQFVSTDYPVPVGGVDYVATIPGGAPSRCNPVTAPPECTAEAIERLR